MIYFIILAIIIAVIFFVGLKLFRKPALNYDYVDMVEYNKSIQGTNTQPLPMPPNKSELDVLLQVISDNDNDDLVLAALTKAYEQLMTAENELDVLILTLSDLLYDRASSLENPKECLIVFRAARITRRLAHNLYRKYRAINPRYINLKFIQFVD